MQLLKTFALILVAISLTLVQPVLAQDADADQARALFQRGQEQFNAMEYAKAISTLNSIEAADLPEQAQQQFKALLSKAQKANAAQQQGLEDFNQASSLLKSGDFDAAKAKFKAVSDNEFVPAQLKRDAAAMAKVAQARAMRAEQMKSQAEKAADNKAADAKATAEKAAAEKAAAEKAAAEKAAAEKAAAEKAAAEKAAAEKAAAEKAAAEKAAAEKAAAEKAAAEKAAAEKAAADEKAAKESLRKKAVMYRAREQAKSLVAQGNDYLEVGAADKALQCFKQALTLVADIPGGESGLTRAQAMLDVGTTATSSMDLLIKRNQIKLKETKAKYDAAMADSLAALENVQSEADFVTASEQARFAMSLVQANKRLFETAEFDVRIAKAQQLLDRIAERRAAWQRARELEVRQKATEKAEEYENEQRRLRDQKIASLKDSIRLLEDQRKWDQAIQAAEEILILDNSNAWASSRLELLRVFRTDSSQRNARRARAEAELKHADAFAWDTIPWYDLLRFPEDWAELSRRRQADNEGAESAADRAVRLELEAVKPVFDYIEMELIEAIDNIRKVTGLNITVNWTALEDSGVGRTTPITIKLANVSTARALEEMLNSVGGLDPLGYIVKDGIVRISTKRDLSTIVTTVTYDIKDILFSTPNFQGPVLSTETNDVDAGGGSNDSADIFDDSDDEDDEDVEADRLEAINNLLTTITTSIDPDSWYENGGMGSVSELNGKLIVTQTPENHRRIGDLLKELRDSDSIQISIEARYITVSTGFLNDVGLSLNFFLNTGSTTNGLTPTDILPSTPTTVTPNSAGTTLAQWSNGDTISNNLTPISVIQNSSAFTGGPTTTVPGGIGEAVGNTTALTLAGTFLDDIQVDFLLRATQADQKSSSFLAPRLTLTNGQRAYIAFTKSQSYISGTEAEVDENIAVITYTVTQMTTGNTLDVEAVASADRRYVTMTLRPSLTSLDSFSSFGSADSSIQLPETSETRYRATVKVPDGGTLLVGGQRRAGEVSLQMGTPILNKIPLVNRLFSNRSMVRDEFMTLLLIKPTIIISKEYETYDLPN